ncbi:MAG: hypothetical protein JRG89_19825 [Deltaproteobacteria bacterium]|nr:hypothetical protein [Deltaproteobacteria bacterium]
MILLLFAAQVSRRVLEDVEVVRPFEHAVVLRELVELDLLYLLAPASPPSAMVLS